MAIYAIYDFKTAGFCPVCGRPFPRNKQGRPRQFCSAACRMLFHHKHPKPENWKTTRKAVCPFCGSEFLASREYGTLRKYCSRACANRGRAEERRKRGVDHE